METKEHAKPQPVESRTKECPFCAETIQARAIKCRYCGEFLDTERTRALLQLRKDGGQDSPDSGTGQKPGVLFAGKPSLWGLTGSVIKGLVVIAFAVFLIKYPVENLPIFQEQPQQQKAVSDQSDSENADASQQKAVKPENKASSSLAITEQQREQFGAYRVAGGFGLILLVICILTLKVAWLKTTHYEVTADRIEWHRGLLDRKVDNIDMFRVIDIQMRRSIFDCIVGIGTVTLVTTDKTDPKFTFRKIRRCRDLYDVIKSASLNADRRGGVIHLE